MRKESTDRLLMTKDVKSVKLKERNFLKLEGRSRRCMRLLLILSLVLILTLRPSLFGSINRQCTVFPFRTAELSAIGGPCLNPGDEHQKQGTHGMVSSDVPICSTMGKNILQHGGNAADAAVTVALCIGSVNLHSSGIGGGGFIVSNSREHEEVLSIDARETAPSKVKEEFFTGYPLLTMVGGLANAVPGELKGLDELFKRHGSGNLSWKEVIEPVIELNEKGFVCTEVLGEAVNVLAKIYFPFLQLMAESWDYIYKEGRKENGYIQKGDLVTRKNFADTLRLIANNGSSDIFYDPLGPIAPSLVEASQTHGGVLTPTDFASYNTVVEQPLSMLLFLGEKEREIYTSNGASAGLALLAGLNFYDKVYNREDQYYLKIHKAVESMKWMASARSFFGDFHLNDSNITFRDELIDKFTSPQGANGIINDGKYSDTRTFPWPNYEPRYQLTNPHGTSHFSVVDSQGNAVSMTTTVNLLFGSVVYDNRTGIVMNDEMDDFSVPGTRNAFNLTPSIYNFIEPRKRPMSSTCPLIIMSRVNGTLVPDLVIGAAGGSRITTAVFNAILKVFYEQKPILETIASTRLHHQLIPESIFVEDLSKFDKETNASSYLETLNHTIAESGPLTAMNAISRIDTNDLISWVGVADYWRKRGEADGY